MIHDGLPASYDDWKTTPPLERVERPCECGHLHEDHHRRFIDKLEDNLHEDACDIRGCACVKFYEIEPNGEPKED